MIKLDSQHVLKEKFTYFVPESFLRKTQIMQKENFQVVFTFLGSFGTIIELQKKFKNSKMSTRMSWYPVGYFENKIAVFSWNWSQSTPKSIQQQKRTFFDQVFIIIVQTMNIFVE